MAALPLTAKAHPSFNDGADEILYTPVCFHSAAVCLAQFAFISNTKRNAMNIPPDIIGYFTTTADNSPLDILRDRRPDAKLHAQEAFHALFTPDNPGNVSLTERFALGLFTTTLHQATDLAAFYAEGLKKTGASPALLAAVSDTAKDTIHTGPYGAYPTGPLSSEDRPGPVFSTLPGNASVLGPRLAAALQHTHMLVLHPRDANADAIQMLFDAGWNEDGIVTLSQLVTFLCYQIRLIHGLRVVAETMENSQ